MKFKIIREGKNYLFPLEFMCRYFDEAKNDYIEVNFRLVDGLVNKASSVVNVYMNSKISMNIKKNFKTDLVIFWLFLFLYNLRFRLENRRV